MKGMTQTPSRQGSQASGSQDAQEGSSQDARKSGSKGTQEGSGRSDRACSGKDAEARSGLSDRPHDDRRDALCTNACRAAFAAVFAINVQCALSFVLFPSSYVAGFQLSGWTGNVAVQGLGVAFLMWNCTYPPFIASPRRWPVLGGVILAQQAIGLLGETTLYLQLPTEAAALHASIGRFMAFDAVGLLVMAAAFAWLATRMHRTSQPNGAEKRAR